MGKTQIRHRRRVPCLYVRNVRDDIVGEIEYRYRGRVRLSWVSVCVVIVFSVCVSVFVIRGRWRVYSMNWECVLRDMSVYFRKSKSTYIVERFGKRSRNVLIAHVAFSS